MDNEEKTFEDICFEFQENILKIINDEKYLPFLLKYYLIKDIWESIERHKLEIDMQVRSKKETTIKIPISLENNTEKNKES